MIKVYKNYDEETDMEWRDILSHTLVCAWDGKEYTEYIPQGANKIIIDSDGTCTIEVVNLRVLIDNLANGGVSLDMANIKVVPSRYLNDIQGCNTIVLYKGWFCRVNSCGGVILCTEQEAYNRGLIAI